MNDEQIQVSYKIPSGFHVKASLNLCPSISISNRIGTRFSAVGLQPSKVISINDSIMNNKNTIHSCPDTKYIPSVLNYDWNIKIKGKKIDFTARCIKIECNTPNLIKSHQLPKSNSENIVNRKLYNHKKSRKTINNNRRRSK